MSTPRWLHVLGLIMAVFMVALLLAGIVGVPFRASRSPMGYDQERLHWNTKNSTRFMGANAGEIAPRVSQAVYPAVGSGPSPATVILYDPGDWQGGLATASLLRPLDAVLLPAVSEVQEELARLRAAGAATMLVNEAADPAGGDGGGQQIAYADVVGLLDEAGLAPVHAILVDREDPTTALLAASWAAYSGDLIVFDLADAPAGIPVYALGAAAERSDLPDQVIRIGSRDAAKTAVAFAGYDNPDDPLFGWGMNADSLTGYRAYTLARMDDPASALLSANLARRGKPGPLLWTEERKLPTPVNTYLWSQRAAFWVTPAEGPFHHFWILGDLELISFPAQSQADYAVEIGPYKQKGAGLAEFEMLAVAWVVLGIASALWVAIHEVRFLPQQNPIMRLAWPLLALMVGPFGVPIYILAYSRPMLHRDGMMVWNRPLWLQGLVATVSGVGFGGSLMVVTGYLMTLFGLPLFPATGPLFFLGTPTILSMIASYVVAVLVSWPLYQTPMLSMFYGRSYSETLPRALPIVMISMASVSLAMFPGMWWFMTSHLPMMPNEEAISWFGIMFVTVFMGLLISWPFNYAMIRQQVKSGLM